MKKKIGIALILLAVLSALIGLSPAGAFGFFIGSNIHGYYTDSNSSKKVNDIWIHPIIEGSKSHFALPPLYVNHSESGPYQVGFRFVDYDNKNQCESVEITELVAIHRGIEHNLLAGEKKVFGPFQTYVSGVQHVKLDALLEAGDWLNETNKEDIEIRAKIRIIRSDDPIEFDFTGKVKPIHIEGIGTILDALSA